MARLIIKDGKLCIACGKISFGECGCVECGTGNQCAYWRDPPGLCQDYFLPPYNNVVTGWTRIGCDFDVELAGSRTVTGQRQPFGGTADGSFVMSPRVVRYRKARVDDFIGLTSLSITAITNYANSTVGQAVLWTCSDRRPFRGISGSIKMMVFTAAEVKSLIRTTRSWRCISRIRGR